MYWYLRFFLSLLWMLMNALVLCFVAMNTSLKYSFVINFHESYYEHANFSVHCCKMDCYNLYRKTWMEVRDLKNSISPCFFFFIFSVVSVLEWFTNVSYIFPLKHDTVIIYFVFLFYLLFYNRSLFYYQLFFQ